MSYQPEERYWTDYLRIALPVVGLLLMLGLFWYWANNVIGDSGNSDKPTPSPQVMVINSSTATATTAPVVAVTAQPNVTATVPGADTGPATLATNTPDTTATGNSSTTIDANAAAPNGTGNTSGASGNTSGSSNAANGSNATGNSANPSNFNKGDTVQTNTDSVRMRDDHSVSGNVVETIDATGTQLNVTGAAGVVDGDYTWIQVQDPSTEQEGWVADSLVDLSS